jgi:D-alanine transfer protein
MALAIVAFVVGSGPYILARLGPKALKPQILRTSMQKNMGTLLQSLALADPALLPVYGSSELTRQVSNRADRFFWNAPTGFRICPVGGPGNTSLLMAQKFASLGSKARDRKVAIILSCSWFRRADLPADQYAGNFSPAQAMNIVLSGGVSTNIRRRLAERMLDFPETVKKEPALFSNLRGLVSTDSFSRMIGWSQRPLLYAQRAAMNLEDNLATLLNMAFKRPRESKIEVAVAEPFSWEKTLARADEFKPPYDAKGYDHWRRPGVGDKPFIKSFGGCKEWDDFELLLDTLASVHAKPLVIVVPLDGTFEDAHGVSLAARNYFYNRLGTSCAKRGFSFAHFPEHDLDTDFVFDHSSHPTGKGWLFIDRLLDDFYHDRLPVAPDSVTKS